MPTPLNLTAQREQRFRAKLKALLEQFGYQDGIGTLQWDVQGNAIQGKFADRNNSKAFEFTVNGEGIAYKPLTGAHLDALTRGVSLVRHDSGKNRCTAATSYACGNTCISRNKQCRIRDVRVRQASLALVNEAKLIKSQQSAQRVSPEQLQRTIDSEESKIRNLPYERGVVIHPGTGKVLINKGGQQAEVVFTAQEAAQMKGAVITHNHPNLWNAPPPDPRSKGISFSDDDIRAACVVEAAEIRAVSTGYTHSMKPPKGGWNTSFYNRRVAPAYRRNGQRVYRELVDEISTGKTSAEQAEVDFHHRVWERTAKETGMTYTRTEVRGDSINAYKQGLASVLRIDKGKPCGKGHISSGKQCHAGEGVEVRSPKLLSNREKRRIGVQVAAGIVILAAVRVGLAFVAYKALSKNAKDADERAKRQYEERQREYQQRARKASTRQNPTEGKNWWDVLGVRPDATKEEIKKAYRQKSKEFHPDVSKHPEAAEMMKEINNAFDQSGKRRGDSQTNGNPDRLKQIMLAVKQVIGTVYRGGIDALLSLNLQDDGAITGKFQDAGQVYDYTISSDNKLSYVESSARSDAYLLGYHIDSGNSRNGRFDAPVKTRQCKQGKPCGSTCIAKGLSCEVKLSAPAAATVDQIRSAISQVKNSVDRDIPASKIPFDQDPKFKSRLAGVGLTVGIAAAAAGTSFFLVDSELKQSSVPFDSIRQPPGGTPDEQTYAKYDTFQPGDLIRKNFKSDDLGSRQHYAVYIGKDPKTGEHMLIDTGTDYKTRDNLPYVRKRGLTWDAGPNDSEYEKVPESEMHQKENTRKFSRQEIVERADKMLYQRFTYQGFDSNCEAFARAIVEGKAYSSQGDKVSGFTRAVSSIVTDNVLKLRTSNEYFPGSQGERVLIKIGPYSFTGVSSYAKEKNRWTAQQMADFLEQDRIRETRRKSYEWVANPYSGKVENETVDRLNRKTLPAATAQDVSDFFNTPFNRKRTDSEDVDQFLNALGLQSPEDYAKAVEVVAQEFPGVADSIRISMYKNYLLLMLGALAQTAQGKTPDGSKRQDDASSSHPTRSGYDWVADPRTKDGGYFRKKRASRGTSITSPANRVNPVIVVGGVSAATVAVGAAIYAAHTMLGGRVLPGTKGGKFKRLPGLFLETGAARVATGISDLYPFARGVNGVAFASDKKPDKIVKMPVTPFGNASAVREWANLKKAYEIGVGPKPDRFVPGMNMIVMENLSNPNRPGGALNLLALKPDEFNSPNFADTLTRFHAAGLTHGDLSFTNVMVDRNKKYTLIDLGNGEPYSSKAALEDMKRFSGNFKKRGGVSSTPAEAAILDAVNAYNTGQPADRVYGDYLKRVQSLHSDVRPLVRGRKDSLLVGV